jgi:hypothetical protein
VIQLQGWRAIAVLLVAALVGIALLLALVWLAAVLAILAGVVWLNVVALPRLSKRLRIRKRILDVALLVILAGGGWLLNEAMGLGAGVVIWLAGIGAPRAAAAWLQWRLRRSAAHRVHSAQSGARSAITIRPGTRRSGTDG